MSTLISIAFYHLLFFVALILSKTQKFREDYLLLTWLLVLVVHFSGFYMAMHQLPYYEFLVELSGACVFLHGPILFSYWKTIKVNSTKKQKLGHHFLPAFINCLLIPFLVIYENSSLSLLLGVLKISSCFYYALLLSKKAQRYIAEQTSILTELEAKKIKWFKILINGILIIASTGMISLFLSEMQWVNISMNGELFVAIFLTIFVFLLSYIGLRQTAVFIDYQIAPTTAISISPKTVVKYKNTGLDSKHSEKEYKKVLAFMHEHKPYLDAQITLLKLSELVQIPSNQLSQIINQNAHQNFFSFINSFRIAEVIGDIQKGKHKQQTLLALALSAGFNSKSSFNRAFKKITQQTPSAYIKKMDNNTSTQL